MSDVKTTAKKEKEMRTQFGIIWGTLSHVTSLRGTESIVSLRGEREGETWSIHCEMHGTKKVGRRGE